MKSKLTIYNNDAHAPRPTVPLTPGACAVISDKNNRIFLHKRSDNLLWALPGGTMRLGESISQCCLREIKEEVGINVSIERMVGIYSSPKCVFDFGDGRIFQSFVIAFYCKMLNGEVKLNNESTEFNWFSLGDINQLNTLPFVKEIIIDAFKKKEASFD